MRAIPQDIPEVLRRWPRVVAHVICESLGYCTPTSAAWVVLDGKLDRPNYCEWLAACYGASARRALRDAVRHRHLHRGFMASYPHARLLVERAVRDRQEPVGMSW